MYKNIQRIHFVGVGGIGMSGIAEVLLNMGYEISGSDLRESSVTKRLKRRGAKIWVGHKSEHVEKAQVVVTSSAVTRKNPEVMAALKQGIPVIARAEMLSELMRMKYGIAVAGTHGKTTTTSLIGSIATAGELDPTIIIGGRVRSLRSNARLGRGDYLVAEADESDGSFLHLHPTIVVVTNIDPEHMDHYKNYTELKETFARFCRQIPFYGTAIFCADHPASAALAHDFPRRFFTYGFSKKADFCAKNLKIQGRYLQFNVLFQKKTLGAVKVALSGKHNARNALAAIAVAHELGIPFHITKRVLKTFKGIARRAEILYQDAALLIVDDYAHHPAEIRATLDGLKKSWPAYRLRAIFQPHRYTRTKELFSDFTRAFGGASELTITDIYPASEPPIIGVTARRLAKAIKKPVRTRYLKQFDDITETLWAERRLKDLIVTLGAGNVGQIAHALAKKARGTNTTC